MKWLVSMSKNNLMWIPNLGEVITGLLILILDVGPLLEVCALLNAIPTKCVCILDRS